MNTMALLAGADIIRVHDVAEHRDIIHLISATRERSS
jgi:dihydropteroate synthase